MVGPKYYIGNKIKELTSTEEKCKSILGNDKFLYYFVLSNLTRHVLTAYHR